MNHTDTDTDTYFVHRKKEQLLEALHQKINHYYNTLNASGTLALWRRSHFQYNAGYYNSGLVQSLPPGRDIKKIIVNDFRNIIEHIHILVTKQPPKLKANATNNTTPASEVIPTDILLGHYQQYMGMDSAASIAQLYDLLYGAGYVGVFWDYSLGETYINNPKHMMKTGDLSYKAIRPIDVIHDFSPQQCTSINQIPDWIIVREFVNKYDLAVSFPQYKNDILATPSLEARNSFFSTIERVSSHSNQDFILLYRFYHKQTPAIPLGQEILFTENNVLLQTPLKYSSIPVLRTASNTVDSTFLGYSIAFDLLSIQNAKDKLISTILTNQAAFGLQMILNPRGSNIQYKNPQWSLHH